MDIDSYISQIGSVKKMIVFLLDTEFNMDQSIGCKCYEKNIMPYFKALRRDIFILIETKYVDRTYRDSYYNYYSSKSNNYIKYCIRLSLFKCRIELDDFRNETKVLQLQENYLGFITLRPTPPNIIGRSIISPIALISSDFSCCTSVFNATARGLKFNIEGFPHSSQDAETITCAETSLWAIMEYFGNKYSGYLPTLPSKIIRTLENISYERQIPSQGLHTEQISYALKQFGFGSKVYSRDEFKSEFDCILSCYIESGIPLIIVLDKKPPGSIGHIVLAIGHENLCAEHFDKIEKCHLSDKQRKYMCKIKLSIYDFDSINKEFIFIDDNCPAYQRARLKEPTVHYKKIELKKYKIAHIIVPLYSKIYLDAVEAKNVVINFLQEYYLDNNVKEYIAGGDGTKEIIIRVFLATSRSYKAKLAINEDFDKTTKNIIMDMAMPKFIWVAEISNKEFIKAGRANGLILLDATEANISDHKPILGAFFESRVFLTGKSSGILEIYPLYSGLFKAYNHNLTLYNKTSYGND